MLEAEWPPPDEVQYSSREFCTTDVRQFARHLQSFVSNLENYPLPTLIVAALPRSLDGD